jgi:hypothetical protein
MHQVRTLRDLDSNIPWNAHMIKINRKTLVTAKPDTAKSSSKLTGRNSPFTRQLRKLSMNLASKDPPRKGAERGVCRADEREKAKFREYRAACSEAREYLAIRENIASLYDAERRENADRKKRKEQER